MPRCLLALLFAFAAACDAATPAPPTATPTDAPDAATDAAPEDAGTLTAQADPAPPRCEARIAERAPDALREGHDAWLERLPHAVVNGRLTPIAFGRAPAPDPAGDATREALARSRRPGRTLSELRRLPAERLRAAFLREGYFVVPEECHTVRALSSLRLDDLFEEPSIVRERGDSIETLDRNEEGRYVDSEGRRARLRFQDRLAVSVEALGPPLHFDLGAARDATGALQVSPTAQGEGTLAVHLGFAGGAHLPALLERREGRTHLVCIGGSDARSARVLLAATVAQRRAGRVRAAAEMLVRERPRFDEPIDEPEGVQEDGQLRRAWYSAYRRGERTFRYREVEYRVFDHHGAPVPPEVCVDFVFDAWERGGGDWYRPYGEPPGRTEGDWALTDVPRRSVRGLVDAASLDPRLAHYEVPRSERVGLREGAAFVEAMTRLAHSIEPGDALVVYGLREQDMRNHYHALLVLEVDPVTGIPSVLADNQGRPALRNLRSALAAAPRRAIEHRVRLDLDALAVPSS